MAYILETEFGIKVPDGMKQLVGNTLSHFADQKGAEIESQEVYEAFEKSFVNITTPLHLLKAHFERETEDEVQCTAELELNGTVHTLTGTGNGPINALVQMIDQLAQKDYSVVDYQAHAMSGGSDSQSVAYIQLKHDSGKSFWGVGLDPSIGKAGLYALVTAWNLMKG